MFILVKILSEARDVFLDDVLEQPAPSIWILLGRLLR